MQAEVMKCNSKHVGVTGGSGSGKSILGAVLFCAHAMTMPNAMGLVVGRDYNQVMGVQWKATTKVLRWWERVNGLELIRTASKYAKQITLINGFTIVFRTATEIERIQGLEVQVIWCDEWATWPDQRGAWNELHARLRPSEESHIGHLKSIWTSTPKGAFGIASIFQDRCQVKTGNPRITTSEHTPDQQPYLGYSLFRMSSRENTAFDESFVEQLMSNFSSDEARSEIDGEIITLAGSVFGHVFSTAHNVIPFTFDPAKHRLAAAIDHGSNYPYCALIARFDDARGEPADCIIREFTKDGIRGVQEIVFWIEQEMRTLGASKLYGVFPDPDAQYKRENSLLATHFRCPVHAYEAREYRAIGWGTGIVKARLCDALGHRHLFVARDVSLTEANKSINGRGCVRGFQSQEWSEARNSKNVFEELQDDWKDLPGTHAMDAIRYFCSHEYKYLSAAGLYQKQGRFGMTVYR